MPPKKRSFKSSNEKTLPSKKRRHESRLTTLPAEILDLILSYCLPDPTDLHLPHHLSTVDLLTEPILQTSSGLRAICLKLINAKCLWIVVRLIDPLTMPMLKKDPRLKSLPLVTPQFQGYVAQDAPKICLTVSRCRAGTRKNLRSSSGAKMSTFMLPYNFDDLLRICQLFKEYRDELLDNLKVEYHNVAGCAAKRVADLVLPALSALRKFNKVHFELNGEESHTKEITALSTIQHWTPCTLLQKAKSVQRNINALKSKGYEDEAGFLLLRNYWIVKEAVIWLPFGGDWTSGEFEEDPSDHCLSVTGNKLRSSIHWIEHGACLAYFRLTTKYGELRFSFEPTFFVPDLILRPFTYWFGLTPTELCELHYRRALVYEDIGRGVARDFAQRLIEQAKDPSQTSDEEQEVIEMLHQHHYYNLKCAVTEMFYAHILNPGDVTIHKHLTLLRGELPWDEQETLWNSLSIVLDGSDESGQILWGGDRRMVDQWGGIEMLKYFPMTQKGLEDSSTFADWWEEFHPYLDEFGSGWPLDVTKYYLEH